MEVGESCLPGLQNQQYLGKISALVAGIRWAPVGGHLPSQDSQLSLVPWPFLGRRGKAAGSPGHQIHLGNPTGGGGRSARANEKQVASISPLLAG